ncbi:helix-turn-helix domain-containing protein [Saccharospirillum salsuginis]|uniref:Transcriptional regulator n=1 Tax=Saccharospirillum salsuginis TaxID=418750 RepID=A0A918NF51_9GAMM|nr:helix-turn-helix transcriptional regulator [Saccharospirillum salsuginis]GGX62618.1 transcriptional regulator [Saccharospirillum salsuginis]
MKAPTDVQIIHQGGEPAFAVIPYEQYLELLAHEKGEAYVPHEVVGLQIKKGLSLIAAWRVYKGLNQKQLADRMGVTQPAIAQIEKAGVKAQAKTLQKVADALGVRLDQITK